MNNNSELSSIIQDIEKRLGKKTDSTKDKLLFEPKVCAEAEASKVLTRIFYQKREKA